MPEAAAPLVASELPRPGMLANVRNRLAVIAAVEPYSHPEQLHWVRVEYLDQDGPPEDQILWEREASASVWPATQLPDLRKSPMSPREFDAFVRATRWSATTPFIGPAAEDGAPTMVAPLYGAVQVEDFQLVPLFEALRMSRVALLLADDVGLGKTIEAGLILNELLIRRRIRRILIICPASLRYQWQQEMRDKFSLGFDVIDRAETLDLQKRLGLDTNPWRAYPRIIASYHYLKQADILQQFLATCRQPENGSPSAQLPWDLLVVDEAHNLTPAYFGNDSDLAQMLRRISPQFEHRLFLTATPHNGFTRSFTGLLQQLDPVRFQQSTEVNEDRVKEVVIRRLKREIREADRQAGRPERFAERRPPQPVPLFPGPEERNLSHRFAEFRTKLLQAIARQPRGEQLAGRFAVEILNKRLLSCPFTFADSWLRFKEGTRDTDPADSVEVRAAQTAAGQDSADDREREERARHAARTVGAWLKPWTSALASETAALDDALASLGLAAGGALPRFDERYNRLKNLINDRLRDGNAWRNDERLIIFTEYKTTLDYLKGRLEHDFRDNGNAIRVLFGDPAARDNRREIIRAFNDPADPVRVLVATDVASEGINLQETARLLLHFDIPWNPARLEQRNGRLDRHGQPRDVTLYHFASDDDADIRFCARVAEKVSEIREDLGSVEDVLDSAFQRHFSGLENAERVLLEMNEAVDHARGRASIARDMNRVDGTIELERLERLRNELDLSPEGLRSTLEVAIGMPLQGPDHRLRFQVPLVPAWRALIDEALRTDEHGPLRGVVFDPRLFITSVGSRPVFRPMKDTVLLHLGHPLFRRSLATFAHRRYPGKSDAQISRWSVRRGGVPDGLDALILLTIEELAANELRQPFHHWVTTLRIPVSSESAQEPLTHVPAGFEMPFMPAKPGDDDLAKDLWLEVDQDIAGILRRHAAALTSAIGTRLQGALREEAQSERERFRSRRSEIKTQLSERSIARLTREVEALRTEAQQLHFDSDRDASIRAELRLMEDELTRRTQHDNELLAWLEREEKRVVESVIPRRFALRGNVQVFPVAVEIRLPEVNR